MFHETTVRLSGSQNEASSDCTNAFSRSHPRNSAVADGTKRIEAGVVSMNEPSEIPSAHRIIVELCVYPQLEHYYTERLRYFARQASNRYANDAKRRRKQ